MAKHTELPNFTCFLISPTTDIRNVFKQRFDLLSFERILLLPLLGHARFWGRCWAAIRLFHYPEPSGRAVRGEVDGLDIGGRHGRRFVLLRQTHRPQRRPYLICTSRSRNVRLQSGGGLAGPRLFLGGSFQGNCTDIWNQSVESCGVVWPLCVPLMIHPPPHVCCCF